MNQLAVIAWIGVQVVVVVVEAGFLQVLGHAFFQQAKGATGLQSQRLHRPDDRLQLFDVARLRATPCSAHAEAAGTPCLGNACLLQHALHVHQLLGWHRIGMMDGLRAVCAVLGAAPGLHRQQGRELDVLRIEVLPVHGGRTIDQVHERRLEQGFHRADRPVGSGGVWRGAAQLDCGHRIGHACVSWLWPVASGGYSVSGASGQSRSSRQFWQFQRFQRFRPCQGHGNRRGRGGAATAPVCLEWCPVAVLTCGQHGAARRRLLRLRVTDA